MKTRTLLALSACLLATAPLSQAITISATAALPDDAFNFGLFFSQTTETYTTPFTTFDFSSQAFASITSLESLQINLQFFNFDTDTDLFDRNNITLTLAGFNTGVLLNGFGNGSSTATITGNILNNADLILTALQNTGVLSAGFQDITSSPSNNFLFTGGSSTITLSDQPVAVPFTPSHAAGLITLAGASLWLRRRKQSGETTPVAA